MGMTIRAAIDDGAAEFDMLYGHEPYKNLWARARAALGRLQSVSAATSADDCSGARPKPGGACAAWSTTSA